MTEQDINKIKALFPEGEIKCTLTENGIVIEHKPSKPLYVDPDNGDEFYKGEEVFYFSRIGDMYHIRVDCVENLLNDMEADDCSSKVYLTREKCEIALAEFIAGKHGKKLVDRGRVYFDTTTNILTILDDSQCSFE